MTCKNCYIYGLCSMREIRIDNGEFDNYKPCKDFKDESLMVELPCKVGQTVYQTDGVRIYEGTVCEIDLSSRHTIYVTDAVAFDERAIGTNVLLTKEEAEKALKEREENDG